jgi:chromosome partitioning protein
MTERRRAVRAAVVMPKGGVGKTATAAALAWGLREHKKRTLVVDLDPQMADLSLVLGVDKLEANYTSRELMLHPEREFAPVKLDEYLDLVPADPDPVLTEMRLGKETMVSGPVKLRRALDRLADRYDYILCDCRPGGGAVMANALVACRQIVAPVQLTRFAASCIVELSTILSEVFDGQVRPAIRYLPTFWTNDLESEEALAFVEENCRGALFGSRIPRAVAIARSMAEAASLFDPRFKHSKGAEAYRAFVEEFLASTEASHV